MTPDPAAGLPSPNGKSKSSVPFINRPDDDMFSDLLAGYGINQRKKTTMVQMVHTENDENVSVKVHNWAQNHNGNVRALLSSLDQVLWPAAEDWIVPCISEMFNDDVVKKVYFKACLLVHPDKQMGQPHHALAQAIFTELNMAMIAFENTKK